MGGLQRRHGSPTSNGRAHSPGAIRITVQRPDRELNRITDQLLDLPRPAPDTWSSPGVRIPHTQHMLSGNAVRFERARLRIEPDKDWQETMSTQDRRIVTALSAPLLFRYGYLRRPHPARHTRPWLRPRHAISSAIPSRRVRRPDHAAHDIERVRRVRAPQRAASPDQTTPRTGQPPHGRALRSSSWMSTTRL
jgi:hypothetical protein